jgi:Tol biopolymer transport system component
MGLWAVPFALSRLEITGEPFLVTAGGVGASISRTSRLAYVPVSGMPPSRLRWVDRQGREIGRQAEPGILERWPSLSSDGSRATVVERVEDRWDVWTHDLKSGARRRLTTDGFARQAVWMPDDQSVVYTSVQPGVEPLMKRAAADGSGLLEEIGPGREPAVSADGRRVFYVRDFKLFHRPLVEAGQEVAYLSGPDRQSSPRPSPDGRFVTYVFYEASTFKRSLFVKPFPSGDERFEVAANALNPRWSGDGRRLFFAVDADIMEVDVQTTPRFRVGVPRKLFSISPLGASTVYSGFDVSGDGQRFLMIESDASATTQTVVVVLDFTPEK